jgi:hypothetical protein
MTSRFRTGALVTGAIAAVGYVLGVANWFLPTLRFTSAAANAFTLAGILLLPWVVLLSALSLKRVALRILVPLAILPIALLSSLLGLFAVLQGHDIVRTGVDPSLEELWRELAGWGTVAAYRTDGGATTDNGIVLRREATVLPGIVVVHTLYYEYHAYDCTPVRLSGGSGTVWIDGRAQHTVAVPSRPFVWF